MALGVLIVIIILILARCRQFQKRNHFFRQFRLRQFQNVGQWRRIGHIKFPGHGTPQDRQVRAATEFLTEFMRNAADISAFGAANSKLAQRRLVAGKSEVVNVDESRFSFDFDAFARQFVQRHAFLFHG